jgi:transcription antitermination factor NusA-like protein
LVHFIIEGISIYLAEVKAHEKKKMEIEVSDSNHNSAPQKGGQGLEFPSWYLM